MQVDIGMRMLVNADSYAKVGELMDVIEDAVRRAIDSPEFQLGKNKVHFDFTSFNTNPCKALALDREANAMYGTPQPGPADPGVVDEMAQINGMNVSAQIEDEF